MQANATEVTWSFLGTSLPDDERNSMFDRLENDSYDGRIYCTKVEDEGKASGQTAAVVVVVVVVDGSPRERLASRD